jgi:exopolysaccharide biosynthesis polyprenyl glycosylphosphotransferase
MSSLLTRAAVDRSIAMRPSRPTWAWVVVRALIDALLVNLAFHVAYHVRYSYQEVADEFYRPIDDFSVTRILLTLCILGALFIKGQYRLGRGVALLDEVAGIASSVTVGFAVTVVAGVALRIPSESRLVLLYSWLLCIVGLAIWRAVTRLARYQLWQRGIGIERVVVVGDGESARRLMQALADQQALGYRLIGFVDEIPTRDELTIATQRAVIRAPRLGGCKDISQVVRAHEVDEVFVALPSASHEQVLGVVAACRQQAVRFKLVPDLYEMTLDQVQIDEVNGVPLIGLKATGISGWDAVVKRAVDFGLSVVVLVVGAPILAAIALAIRLDSPGPILFRQVRVGKDERPFVCFKFRSMYEDAEQRLDEVRAFNEADGPIFKMRNDPRCTRVGRWLRRTSIDEVPQVLNILLGQMSWVGPRPPVPAEVAKYETWHRQRLLVTPGLTGLWQVSGRSNLTFDEMVLLDLYYAEHWSLWLDLKILLRTVPAVLIGRGAY